MLLNFIFCLLLSFYSFSYSSAAEREVCNLHGRKWRKEAAAAAARRQLQPQIKGGKQRPQRHSTLFRNQAAVFFVLFFSKTSDTDWYFTTHTFPPSDIRNQILWSLLIVETNDLIFFFTHEKPNQSPLHHNQAVPEKNAILLFQHYSCTRFSPFSIRSDEVCCQDLWCWSEGWRWWAELTNDASLPASSAVRAYYWEAPPCRVSTSRHRRPHSPSLTLEMATSKPGDEAQVWPWQQLMKSVALC